MIRFAHPFGPPFGRSSRYALVQPTLE